MEKQPANMQKVLVGPKVCRYTQANVDRICDLIKQVRRLTTIGLADIPKRSN